MKILYIASEFRDVQVAARALRGISPHVTVLWGCNADRAAFWIRENPDLAALIVEVEADSQGPAFLKHARTLGLNSPIVVVLPEGAAPPRESLEAGADDYLAKNGSFSRALPAIVTRTIERAQTPSMAPWDPLRVETVLADAVGSTSTPEHRPGHSEALVHQREESRTVEQSAADQRQDELEELFDRERATRVDLEQKLAHAMATLEEARYAHGLAATEVERLAQREAELNAMLTDAAATRHTLERRMADTEAALRAVNERWSRERLVAAEQAAGRQTEFQAQLEQEVEKRRSVEAHLARAETAHAEREAEIQAQLEQEVEKRRTAEELLAHTETARADAETAHATREADLDELIRQERVTRTLVEQTLAHGEAAWRDAEEQNASAKTIEANTLAEHQARFKTELSRITAELDDLRRQLSERDARLEEQTARYTASLQAMALDRSRLQDGFQATVAARDREIEQLQETVKATTLELESARTRCEALHANVPELQRQLDESRLELRRHFHRAPVALGRCTRDGALTHVNRAFAELVGSRNPGELRGADFAKTVFESPDDLSWLIERCLSTHARESVETAWKRKSGERVVVRVSAAESAPDLIEIAVEDITPLRALQERLGQAHRMEAVGRVASEIAVTCGHLLRDVHQDAQQWLTTVSDNAALRQRGERLLDEVTRAAGFLERLAAYGDEQTSALETVDLNTVLRDLKPVLKQVAGDEVVLELPTISAPFTVDVKAEHVERLLVNLASYGRERMPLGGRLTFELATVVVDQRFIAQHPSVRPGPHVLVTVTEVRRATRAEGSLHLRDNAPTPDAGGVAPEKPGVDLGAMQELIRECGGHLWMTVEPAGHMVVQIHLPLRGGDDQAQPRGSGLWALGSGLWARVRGSD